MGLARTRAHGHHRGDTGGGLSRAGGLVDRTNGNRLREERGCGDLIHFGHAVHAALRSGLTGILDEDDVLSGIEILLGIHHGNPSAGTAVGPRFIKFRHIVSVFGRHETELDIRRLGFDGGSDFRFRLGMEPEQAADAEADEQDDASQQWPQGFEILLK